MANEMNFHAPVGNVNTGSTTQNYYFGNNPVNFPGMIQKIIGRTFVTNDPLHYRNDLLTFQGREKEIAWLDSFLDSSDTISWTAVVGAAGMGKSKLAYHYLTTLSTRHPGWQGGWLKKEDVDDLVKCSDYIYDSSILLVADYATSMADKLGEWMQKLLESDRHPPKVRILLLEQEDIDGQITPLWYTNLLGNGTREVLIRGHQHQKTRCLHGLTEKEQKDLVINYAARKNHQLNSAEVSRVLKLAGDIESSSLDCPRPLILLMTADAMIEKALEKSTDLSKLSDYIIKRLEIHWESLSSKAAIGALTEVLCFATAVGGIDLEQLQNLPKPLTEAGKTLISVDSEQLERLVASVNMRSFDEDTPKLLPLEPDLVGEYYVLNQWKKHRYDKQYIEAIISECWHQNAPAFWGFLNRVIRNHSKNKEFSCIFSNGFQMLAKPSVKAFPLPFAMLLVNLSCDQSLEDAAITINKLRSLCDAHPDSIEIALVYAKGLFNLSCDQSLEDAAITIDKLRSLCDAHPDSVEIALAYAKGLVNLSNNQSGEDAAITIDKLRSLCDAHPDSVEIALFYAQGLFNLSNNQSGEDAAITIDKLRSFCDARPDSVEIALEYAKGLFNLSCDQSLEDAAITIDKLRSFCDARPDSVEIALVYAQGLFNLSNNQSGEDAAITIDKLRSLCDTHPDSIEIALVYAKGLVNLSNKQSGEDAAITIDKLRSLCDAHPDSVEIALEYAKGLVNLSNKQSGEDAAITIVKLRSLCDAHPDSDVFAVYYAGGLINMGKRQNREDSNKTHAVLISYLAKRDIYDALLKQLEEEDVKWLQTKKIH